MNTIKICGSVSYFKLVSVHPPKTTNLLEKYKDIFIRSVSQRVGSCKHSEKNCHFTKKIKKNRSGSGSATLGKLSSLCTIDVVVGNKNVKSIDVSVNNMSKISGSGQSIVSCV